MIAASETNNTEPNAAIRVTDSAATKVYELIQEEGNPELKLRVFITGGGCSGFQYGFSFDEKVNEDDFEIIKKLAIATATVATNDTNVISGEEKKEPDNMDAGIKLVVDAQSFAHLKGAEIDYSKDIHGERFIIRNNPNAKTTCGCGSSFSTE